MLESVRMGSPAGNMFRTNIATKSAAFTKLRYLPNRVPDETKNLVDSVFDIDTGRLLRIIGVFKLFLVVPMLIMGIILISINSVEIEHGYNTRLLSSPKDDNSQDWNYDERRDGSNETRPTELKGIRTDNYGNENLAPVWTGMMLATSAATDFIAVWRRRGFTIILYMLISTMTFVVSILCIEYDRLEIAFLLANDKEGKDWLKYRMYMACLALAGIAVTMGLLSMYVGSRMSALEESRLYMEREGKKAVLKKKDPLQWINAFAKFSLLLGRKPPKETTVESLQVIEDSDDIFSADNTDKALDGINRGSQPNLVLAPQNLLQSDNDLDVEQGRTIKKDGIEVI